MIITYAYAWAKQVKFCEEMQKRELQNTAQIKISIKPK